MISRYFLLLLTLASCLRLSADTIYPVAQAGGCVISPISTSARRVFPPFFALFRASGTPRLPGLNHDQHS
jgi:hypothetical protein